jgi:hypothetical protein
VPGAAGARKWHTLVCEVYPLSVRRRFGATLAQVRAMRTFISLVAVLLATPACGGSSGSDANPDAGSGGSGASSGSGGTGASAGSGGQAASAGSGASGGHEPVVGECVTDDDCELLSDCCNCIAAPKGKVKLPYCEPTPCFADQCSAAEIKQARCIAGQCIKALDCDGSKVLCNGLPPPCEGGEVPSVDEGCWGPCVPAVQCASVANCSDCPGGTSCVVNEAFTSSAHCVNVPAGCAPDCSCLGKAVCTGGFNVCIDKVNDGSAVHCECPAC